MRSWSLAGVGAASLALAVIQPAFAYGSDTGLIQSSNGIIVVSCETPNPVGAETSPTVSSGGVTVPSVTLPSVPVPQVTINQVTVGPETVGPYTVGGFTVGGQTIGGGTVGGGGASNTVAAVGATNCAALNVTSPGSPTLISGSIRIELTIDELNPTTGATGFVPWSSTLSTALTVTPTTVGVDLATGQLTDDWTNVPAAGQRDPVTGNLSTGIAQIYVGVPLAVNGVQQNGSLGCQAGDFSCSTSETFPVF